MSDKEQSEKVFMHSLHLMRGVLATWVLLYHINFPVMEWVPLLRIAPVSVDAFFILSGFMLAHNYKKTFKYEVTGQQWSKYMVMRIARIYPLYFITSIICVTIQPVNPQFIISKLTFFAALFDQTLLAQTINQPSWSVTDEFIVYLFYPYVIQCYFRNPKKFTYICYSLLIFLTIFTTWIQFVQNGKEIGGIVFVCTGLVDNIVGPFAWVRVFYGYILGMLVFSAYLKHINSTEEKPKYYYSKICGGLIVIILIFMKIIMIIINHAKQLVWVSLIVYFILVVKFAILIFYLSLETDIFMKFSEYRVCQIMGDESYTIYICQVPFLIGIEMLWKKIGNTSYIYMVIYLISDLLIYFLLCYLIFNYLEMPAKKYIQQWYFNRQRQNQVQTESKESVVLQITGHQQQQNE